MAGDSPRPGVKETAPFEGTSIQSGEPLGWQRVRIGTSMAWPISRMVKWSGAGERDGSGRSSNDARGQHNPGRAKDPWGLWSRSYGENGPDMAKAQPEAASLTARGEDAGKQESWQRRPDLAIDVCAGAPGRPALTAWHTTLEPYWGKPAVRNLREGAGNGAMAARGGHSPETAAPQPDLAKPERHRASALLDSRIEDRIRLRDTRPFRTENRPYLVPKRSLFNKIVGEVHAGGFELAFARFLDDNDRGVAAFAKNYLAVGFKLAYVRADGDLSTYTPDFIVRAQDGTIFIVETKGREEIDLPQKMKRLREWCIDVTAASHALGGPEYRFLFVDQPGFEKHRPRDLAGLASTFREFQE